MKKKINVLIVDDHAMVRLGLAQAIERQRDLCLVDEACNASQALELYRKHQPDVVTMDFKLPGPNGVEATAAIRAEFPDARILLLSIYEGSEDIRRAMQAGASGYVSKAAEIQEVIMAVRSLAAGKNYFSPGLAERLAKSQSPLSPQELNVLREIAAGRSAKEISNILNLTEPTVRFHLKNTYAKLGVADRTQAVTTAVHYGIIHLDP